MDRIILFDIDGTIFNARGFLDKFYGFLASEFKLSEKDVEEIKNYYKEIKEEFGFFTPFGYLQRIYSNYPYLEGKLDFYFSKNNLKDFFFEDSKILFDLKDIRIGIFSRGDRKFQASKLLGFENILEKDLVFIFHNKIKEIPGILEKHNSSEIFIVDDRLDVLLAAKDADSRVSTIFIDRRNEAGKVNGINFKLNSLSDIISILNE